MSIALALSRSRLEDRLRRLHQDAVSIKSDWLRESGCSRSWITDSLAGIEGLTFGVLDAVSNSPLAVTATHAEGGQG